uniref:LTD domain-containing protein n=1 Tax=Pyxicephalus adspersus TaxID=30357 RepID=A0AAV3A7D5_PYXAD|nr:TPA: hypothetical protein GDO54_015226 [Pyxicephalus adspersus]
MMVHSQNLIKNFKDVNLDGRLLINEVNPDNPGHDIAEFIELRHTSGQNVSLDGYTLVLYNGKTNTAYKVLSLMGYSTDRKGFFLIGSMAVKPAPTIILPRNTIQNGPDAIALYFGKGPYKESMQLTQDGLVDALVHKSKSTDQADDLLKILTPGSEAFLEDPNFHSSDESIGRCLDIAGKWTFHLTHLSPGSENHCKGFPIMINEVSSPYADDLYVEIRGPPSTSLSGLTIAFINGMDQQVYFSTDIRGQTDSSGLFLLVNEKHDNRAQQTLPNNARLLHKGGGAVALYLGKSTDVLQKNRYTTSGLVNALVYGDYEDMGLHPLQDLTTDNNIIYWHTCFPSVSTLSFVIADCSFWNGGEDLSDLLTAVAESLQALCKCHVSANIFTDAILTCQPRLLMLHAKQNATLTPQSVDIVDIQLFVTKAITLNVRNKSATVTSTCTQSTMSPTTPPEIITTASPPFNPGLLLINEVNPNSPGSAEDMEYLELYHTSNSSVSLAGYWLVFYNGKNNLAYSVLDLKGYNTDDKGYFLIGSNKMIPKPHYTLPDGLVDAIVYVSQAKDDASELLKVLTPGQEAVHEDERFIVEDESLSRCRGLKPLDHNAFQITRITPLTPNDCEALPIIPVGTSGPKMSSPPASSSTPITLLISEVGLMRGSEPYSFIELKGPPGGRIRDYTLVMYNREGKVYERIGVQGVIGDRGLYVISTNGTGDQQLPIFSRPYTLSPEALALYKGRPELFSIGSALTRKDLVDAFVYTWESSTPSEVLRSLNTHSTILYGEHRLSGGSSTALLPVQQSSPGSENICPSTVTSIKLDLCMKDSNLDCSEWMTREPSALDRMKILLSHSIETHCSCTVPPSYIQELIVMCMQDKLSLSGDILSTYGDQLLIHKWNNDFANHSQALQDKSLGSFTGCLMVEKKQGKKNTQIAMYLAQDFDLCLSASDIILIWSQRETSNP